MKIDILFFPSRRRDNQPILAEAQMMQQAAIARGHQAEVVNSTYFSFVFDSQGTQLLYKDETYSRPDLVIAWVGLLNGVAERTAVLEEIEILGIPVMNRRIPVIHTRNKFQTMQMLSCKNLPVIHSGMIHDLQTLDTVLEHLGGFPIVLKTVYGNDGRGVTVFESKRSLVSTLEMMLDNELHAESILLQEFVSAGNKDYRLFVVGDQVVAQMERTAPEGDFRANLAAGGRGTAANLPKEVQELAVRSSKVLGLDISGVDILLSDNRGAVICEVNPRPGFKIADITGVNVAEEIIKEAENLVENGRK